MLDYVRLGLSKIAAKILEVIYRLNLLLVLPRGTAIAI